MKYVESRSRMDTGEHNDHYVDEEMEAIMVMRWPFDMIYMGILSIGVKLIIFVGIVLDKGYIFKTFRLKQELNNLKQTKIFMPYLHYTCYR